MGTVFFLGDSHFGHKKLLTFASSSRGKRFSSIEEHDQTLEDNWNRVVRSKDVVYHCGDVSFGNLEVLKRLRGDKKLIMGNHDKYGQLGAHFTNIYGALKYNYKDLHAIITHIPVNDQSLGKRFTHNIHGHSHDYNVKWHADDFSLYEDHEDERYLNVSVEQINYTPISLEELYERAQN